MASLAIRVTGLPAAQQTLTRLRDGAQEVSKAGWTVGSALPYAFGIETGRHPRGGLARRAGGARYLRGAVEVVDNSARARLVGALPKGAQAVAAALLGLRGDLIREARRRAPKVSGDLRDSIYAVRTGRGG